jgi:hypothetical protein
MSFIRYLEREGKMEIEPNMEWYLSISRERNVAPRCPFATVDRCPRYWDSLSMLQHMGYTSVSEQESQRLEKKWAGSDLRARTAEQDTSVSGSPSSKCLTNYCPEITYESFGVFASFLSEHVDEIDRDMAVRRLSKEGVSQESWKWRWASLASMHYTECPLYSPLLHQPVSTLPDKPKEDLVTLKPTLWGMSINLNEVWRRLWFWFRKSRKQP